MNRPAYVPPQIWEAATYLLDAWTKDDIPSVRVQEKNLRRLLFDAGGQTHARDLQPTWQRIVSSIEELNRRNHGAWSDRMMESDHHIEPPDPGEPYRLLLALLTTLPESMDKEMRGALDEFYQRLEDIAEHARGLAKKWDEMVELRERKGIEWTSEYEIISNWVAAHQCSIEHQNWRDFPNLADLFERIAASAENDPFHPPHGHEYALVGNGGTTGTLDVSATVRKFDSDLKRHSPTSDLAIGDADLARLLSALLRRDIGRPTVLQARKRSQ